MNYQKEKITLYELINLAGKEIPTTLFQNDDGTIKTEIYDNLVQLLKIQDEEIFIGILRILGHNKIIFSLNHSELNDRIQDLRWLVKKARTYDKQRSK